MYGAAVPEGVVSPVTTADGRIKWSVVTAIAAVVLSFGVVYRAAVREDGRSEERLANVEHRADTAYLLAQKAIDRLDAHLLDVQQSLSDLAALRAQMASLQDDVRRIRAIQDDQIRETR